MTHYDTLGVNVNSSPEEIREAYKSKAKEPCLTKFVVWNIKL